MRNKKYRIPKKASTAIAKMIKRTFIFVIPNYTFCKTKYFIVIY
ncbi:hypothetical protein GCM10011518_00760 [Flavobacterium limi]|uniref:Uncharacterized protein n=1 Tax=Flavobacterium limi TaxID=2045105 RepID=A0ABQ1THK0_9FLAO|nr:hypothetical protein GCM10011518_00760 [Flavobacterium limi]